MTSEIQVLSDRVTRLEQARLAPTELEVQILVDRVTSLEQEIKFLETRLSSAYNLKIDAIEQKLRFLSKETPVASADSLIKEQRLRNRKNKGKNNV